MMRHCPKLFQPIVGNDLNSLGSRSNHTSTGFWSIAHPDVYPYNIFIPCARPFCYATILYLTFFIFLFQCCVNPLFVRMSCNSSHVWPWCEQEDSPSDYRKIRDNKNKAIHLDANFFIWQLSKIFFLICMPLYDDSLFYVFFLLRFLSFTPMLRKLSVVWMSRFLSFIPMLCKFSFVWKSYYWGHVRPWCGHRRYL